MSSESANSHGASSPFQSHLAMGLHAFAQPLAILRAKLYAESIARMDADDLAQLANDSAGQVERLCTLFNYLQEIVLAESAEPEVAPCSANDVLEHVADGLELWFQDTCLKLALDLPKSGVGALADKLTLSQAISSLVLLAHGNSKAGDTVTLRASLETDHVVITVANAAAEVAVLNAESRLALALVEIILRKQNGSLSYSLQPLDLRACVPSAAITI